MLKLDVLSGSALGRTGWWLSACALLIACGDDSSTAAPSGDGGGLLGVIEGAPPIGDFDAAMVPEPNPDSSTPDPDGGPGDASMQEPDAGPAFESQAAISGIVLTNMPHIGFTNQGADGLWITSAAFWTTPFQDGLAAVHMYGDVENHSDQHRCIVLSDLFSFDGGPDELVVHTGDPYRSLSSSFLTPRDCVPPGGRGVWQGILLDVQPDFIENVREIRYVFSGGAVVVDDYVPHELAPDVLYADPIMGDAGYAVKGLLRTREMQIYNLSLSFFARNRSGLIFDDTAAYPGDLATLAPNTTVFYESYLFGVSNEAPDSITYYVDFLDGADPTPGAQVAYDPLPEGEQGERIRRAASAERALRDVKTALSQRR